MATKKHKEAQKQIHWAAESSGVSFCAFARFLWQLSNGI
jgi:hypothetical protein